MGSSVPDLGDDDFVGDPGPEFDPKLSPEAPDPLLLDGTDAEADQGWLEQQVRDLLITQGSATNWMFRLHPDDGTWVHTEEDLRAIAPPLTRIFNRYDVTRAAAAAGDEIGLGAALFNYGARNYSARRRLIRQLTVEVPVSGVAAPEGTGPPEPEPREPHGFDPNAPLPIAPRGH